jgi:hypothetical protein
MKKTNLFLLICLIGAISLSSCKEDDDTNPTPDPTGFSFGKMSNQWNYNAISPFFTDTTAYLRVSANLGNNKYLCLMNFMSGFKIDTLYFNFSPTELADYPDDSLPNNTFTIIKDSSTTNIVNTFINSINDTIYRRVLSLAKSVSVPAGNFTCFEIEETYSASADKVIYYIHKTDGFIKLITRILIWSCAVKTSRCGIDL